MSDFSIGAPVYGNEYDGRVEDLEDRADALEAFAATVPADLLERVQAPNVNLTAAYGGTVNGQLTPLFFQGGTTSGLTDGSGHYDIVFPATMNGIVACTHVNGDGVAQDFYTQTLAVNGGQCTIVCKSAAGTPIASQAVRIDWLALGWL